MITLVAKVLTLVLILQVIQEIINMEQPIVNSWENHLDLGAREQIGSINLKDRGAIIAI